MNFTPLSDATTTALLRLAGTLAGSSEAALRLGTTLLAADAASKARRGGISELNNDGSPLQVCLSTSPEAVKLRLIADPAADFFQPALRLQASREVLATVLAQHGAPSLGVYCEQLFAIVLGEPVVNLSEFYRGICWIGASPDQPGVALYLDTRPLGVAGGWEAAETWLSQVLPDAGPARAALAALRHYAVPASIGLEAVSPQAGRAKIYWRLRQPTLLSKLGIGPLARPEMLDFIALVVGNQTMSLSGAVFSISFDLRTGDLEDAKLDLCGHCLPRPAADWITLMRALTDRLGLQPFPVRQALERGECEVAFLGMGMPVAAPPRLNLYLKPAWPVTSSQPVKDLSAACTAGMARALAYLLRVQAADGSWGDYLLPTGSSDGWVTAYVGCALATLGQLPGFAAAGVAARRAADWLSGHRPYTRGWGYNAQTGADADSTAWVIRLLHLTGRPVAAADEEFLLAHWRPTGGFATYLDGPGHWADAHPCVTAVAYLALSPARQATLRAPLGRFLAGVAPANGQWPAYWWRNHFYSTYQHQHLFRQLRVAEPAMPLPAASVVLPDSPTILEQALVIGIKQHKGQLSAAACWDLLHQQLLDGRWPGGHDLRVTEPDCAAPWQVPQGRLYRDFAGTITTATALQVLAEMLPTLP